MVTCPRCGRSNEGKFRFCLGCGASLNPDGKGMSGATPAATPSALHSAAAVPPPPAPPAGPAQTPARTPAAPPSSALRVAGMPVPPPPHVNPAGALRPQHPTPSHLTPGTGGAAARPAPYPSAAQRSAPGGASAAQGGRVDGRLPSPPPSEFQDLLSSSTEPVPPSAADVTPRILPRANRASTVSELETGAVRRVPRPAASGSDVHTAAGQNSGGVNASGQTHAARPTSPPMAPTPRVQTGPVAGSPGQRAPGSPQRPLTPAAHPSPSVSAAPGAFVPRPTVPSPAALGPSPPVLGPSGHLPPASRSVTVNPRIAPSASAGHAAPPPPPGPAAVVQVQPSRARSGGAVGALCDRCGTQIPPSHSFCGVCGAPNAPAANAISSSVIAGVKGERAGVLALIDDGGQESQTFALHLGENRIGAGEDCQIRFGDDGFLAELHCAVDAAPGRIVLRPIDTANGTFLRITTPVEIHNGDYMRVGQEVLAFERLERMQPERGRSGESEVVGWPVPRGVWGRLCQIGLQRQVANAYLLANPDVFLGRERGDILFPKDGFVSGSHAVLSDRNGRAFLKDLGSSNGTFVRVKQDTPLRTGDLFLLGRNLLRVRLGG